ncbi:hypothetical protein CLIT_8c00930 [Peptoclostridium litorale DSM 5388]|uniref:Uncharacterized protein n=1 Tax=Peptoclostridium litorale DSM 5388 TaxID=1121324 RepID=A0A069RFV4_PEPLI|nr:hypothetical protein CLIT_8c00930 [Peptoclostridium litorale DSM 5388]
MVKLRVQGLPEEVEVWKKENIRGYKKKREREK